MNARILVELMDSVADPRKICLQITHIAREYKLQLVFQAVPELEVEQLVNVMDSDS